MAYLTGVIGSGTSSEMFPNFGGETGTGATSESAYAKLLSKFKAFVAGEVSEASSGANVGNGAVMHAEPTKDCTTRSWTLTFSSATNFSITATGEATVSGVLAGVAPNRKLAVSAARFTLSVYEGTIPFTSGDTFTFTSTAHGLNAGEGWDVLADTAKGTAPPDYYSDLYTSTLSGAPTGRGAVASVRYYSQAVINTSYFITFSSATAFDVRAVAAPSVVLGSGVVGTLAVIPRLMDILVTQGGTSFTPTTYTGPTPTGGNFFTLAPKLSSAGNPSNLTRVIVFRHRGFDGSYNIYETIAQRVGNNNNRYFLEGYAHSYFDPAVAMLSQQSISPAWRMKLKNPENAESVPYYIVADAMAATILTLPSSTDPQGCHFGMYEAHGAPSECRFPVVVMGCVFSDSTNLDLDSAAGGASGPPMLGSSWEKLAALFQPGGGSGSVWLGNRTDGSAAVGVSAGGASNSALEAFYFMPWAAVGLGSVGSFRIHSGVYGEPGSKKAVFPTFMVVSTSSVNGVAGELHGLFYIDSGATPVNTVALGDTITIDSKVYVVWKLSNKTTVTNSVAVLLG